MDLRAPSLLDLLKKGLGRYPGDRVFPCRVDIRDEEHVCLCKGGEERAEEVPASCV